MMPGMPGQIVLKAGKAKKQPTDDRSAIRVRALGKSEMFGKAPEGELIVALEVSPEPRLQWQAFQSLRIDKAVDDQDQNLKQVIPQVEGGVGGLGGIAVPAAPVGMILRPPAMVRPMGMWGSLHQTVPVQLKKGAKAAKSLKELKGVITAQILTEAREMIVADKLDKAAGQVFKGKMGGSIKILEVKSEKEQTAIRLALEQPPPDKVIPAQPNAMQGIGAGVPMRLPGAGVKIKPAPATPPPVPAAPPAPPPGLSAQAPAAPQPPPALPQVQIQIRGGVAGGGVVFGGPMQFAGPLNGLSVQDAKGNALPIQIQRTQFPMAIQGNGVPIQTITYTFVCQHGKDKGQPAKVVYLGRKRATVDIPFALKDVPLP